MAAPLLEREPVLAAVDALIDGAGAGRGGTLFVAGDAGAGKTSILAAARARAAGLRTGTGRGSVAEAVLPFGFLEQALAGLGDGSPLEGAPLDAGAGDARAARFHATVRWLGAITASQPALLVLDDLHWADGDSLALLGVVCRRLAGQPLAVVAALRPHPAAALEAAHALASDGVARIEWLRPLTDAAASELIRRRVDAPLDETALRRASDLCAGNPLLLEEAARVIGAGGALPQAGGSTPVGALVLSRLVAGDADALRYGRAAAVLGVTFRPALAGELAGMATDHADAVLELLCRTGLVRDAGPARGEFVHPLFQQALLDSLDGPVRDRLHARAFSLLVALGSTAEAAEHAVNGHLEGDAEAIRILEGAGAGALRGGAVSTAARHLGSAIALAGSRARAATRVALAEAELLSGRESEVAGLCEESSPTPRRPPPTVPPPSPSSDAPSSAAATTRRAPSAIPRRCGSSRGSMPRSRSTSSSTSPRSPCSPPAPPPLSPLRPGPAPSPRDAVTRPGRSPAAPGGSPPSPPGTPPGSRRPPPAPGPSRSSGSPHARRRSPGTAAPLRSQGATMTPPRHSPSPGAGRSPAIRRSAP